MLQHPPKTTGWTRVLPALATLALAVGYFAGAAAAESTLLLPYPTEIGNIPAASYDAQGLRVGPARIEFEAMEGGRFHLIAETEISGGAKQQVEAHFEVVGNKKSLRLLRERSEAHDAGGASLGLLEVDHTSGEARCTPPDGAPRTTVPIPANDRVANVPMSFLFLPLIRGEVDKIHFQVFLCRGGARFMDFVALRANRHGESGEPGDLAIVEVRYGPDLGRMLSWAASRLFPKLSFWFESREGGVYVAHRVPLFSDGPEITVVREGFSPELLVR